MTEPGPFFRERRALSHPSRCHSLARPPLLGFARRGGLPPKYGPEEAQNEPKISG
jgi:hypothetical protein